MTNCIDETMLAMARLTQSCGGAAIWYQCFVVCRLCVCCCRRMLRRITRYSEERERPTTVIDLVINHNIPDKRKRRPLDASGGKR